MWPRTLFALVAAAITALFATIAILTPAGRISQAAALIALVIGLIVVLVVFMTVTEALSRLCSRGAPPESEATNIETPPTPTGTAPRRAA